MHASTIGYFLIVATVLYLLGAYIADVVSTAAPLAG